MLRTFVVCGFLASALSMLNVDVTFGGVDEVSYENSLREQQFSDEDIELFLQEYIDALEETYNKEVFLTWPEARGYDECLVFKPKPDVDRSECTGCRKPIGLAEICADNGCPPFGEVGIGGCGFGARKMLSANWAVTNIDNSDMQAGYTDAFWRLFKYFNKANDQGVRISEAIYLINRWTLGNKFQIESAQMAFYIPSSFQENPPAPTDGLVAIDRWDDATIYSRAFGGHNAGDPTSIKKHLVELRRALRMQNITPSGRILMTYEYVRPGCGKQRNEVMLVDGE